MAEIVRMEGLRELEAAMDALPKAVARNALRRGLTKAAQPVLDSWRSLAPVHYGYYRDSIIIGPSSKLTRRQKSDAKKEGTYFAEVFIGSSARAAIVQEFGTIHMRPHPSGRPAWDSNKAGVLASISRSLWDEINKTAARRAKKLAKG